MPTIIDSLTVALRLDSKKFKDETGAVKKDLRDIGAEAGDAGKHLEDAGKQGAKGFNTATDGLGKFLAKLGGLYVLKKFVVDTIQTNAEIYRFSRNLGESANKISAWSNAIEITGGDARAFQGTLSMLSRSQTELQMNGESGLLPYFSRFNVAMMDAQGNARKGTDILMDFADRMKGMDRTTAFNTLQAMGIDPGTANAMLEGRASLEKLIVTQKEHGAVTDKQALSAENTRRSMTEAEMTANSLKNEMVDGLNPVLKGALDLFNSLDKATGGWSTAILGAVASIGAMRAALAAIPSLVPAAAAAAPAVAPAAAAGSGIVARALGLVRGLVRGGLGVGLMLHSENLNQGEAAELAARQTKGATIDGTDKAARMAALEKQYGLPAGILDKVWAAESGRGKNLKSAAGAEGPFQFMPATAKARGLKNPYDFNESSDAAARYLSDLMKHYGGDVSKAVAAYNWGPGNLDKKGMAAAPAETVGYLSKVLGGVPGATATAAVAGGAAQPGAGGNSQTTLSIGEIKVYTQATDAPGIARDMGMALNSQFPAQANTGLF